MSVPAPAGRLPCLDALRTIAVLLVLLFHQGVLPFGWVGVQLFFVLSGYLISRLLVATREVSLTRYLKDFYGRRALRIFPLYFAFLTLVWLAVKVGLDMGGVREGLPYAATYSYNLFHASDQFEYSKMISHLWSLCVEEQFYLLWPFLIYFCPPQRLRGLLLGIVVAGPLLRLVLWHVSGLPGAHAFHDHYVTVYVLTPSHFDAFALGGLAALFGGLERRWLWWLAVAVLVAGQVAAHVQPRFELGALGYPLGLAEGYGFIWGYSLLNLAAVVLIDSVARRRVTWAWLSSNWLNYLGKISYGLYLFHYPLQGLLAKLLPAAPLGLRIAVQIPLTIGAASLSFHFFEQRWLAFKDSWFPTSSAAPSLHPAPTVETAT